MTDKRQHDSGINEEIENVRRKRRRLLFMGTKADEEPPEINKQISWKSVTLIWYDSEVNKHDSKFIDDMKQTEAMLRRLNDFVFLCSSETDCMAQMERSKSERVLLIISGTCATKTLLEKARSFSHVDTILIFCMNASKYETLPHNIENTKIKGIFTDRPCLKRCIVTTVRAIEKQSAAFALYDSRKQKSTHNLHQECGSFVWLQLIKIALKKIPRHIDSEEYATSKQEMLQKCREYYRDNDHEMKNIDEFDQTYTSNRAIWWYTRDTFLFRLVNKALRTEDIEALYTYRFYIADLCNCLEEGSKLLRERSEPSVLELYRGKKLCKAEIQRLTDGIGQLISVNGFLSTTRDRKVAEMYAGVGSEHATSTDFESVIYKILVDTNEPYVILADLQEHSHFEEEQEVLFDLASVFKIESMTIDNDTKVWTCCMTASSKGATIAKEYIEMKRTSMNNGSVIILLGDLLFDMSEFTKSKIYFENLKNRMPENPNVLFGLGRAYFDLHTDYKQALHYFEMALEICMSQDPFDVSFTAKINDYIGRVHRHQGRYTDALAKFATASDHYKRADMIGQIPYAHMLSGIGYVQYQLGIDDLALQNFQQALEIVQQQTPFDNPDLSNAHMNVSLPLYHMGQYDKALEAVELALAIAKSVVPGRSIHIALILNYIGKYLYKKGDYEQAVALHLESQEIYRHFYPEEKSPYFAVRYNNIGKVYYRTNKYVEADEQYTKAIDILRSLSYDHINMAYTLKNKGELYLTLGDYNQSDDYLNNALKMYERIFPNAQHRDKAKCIYLLGRLDTKRGNYPQALSHYREAYQIWKKTLVAQHPDIFHCLKSTVILLWQHARRRIREEKFSGDIRCPIACQT